MGAEEVDPTATVVMTAMAMPQIHAFGTKTINVGKTKMTLPILNDKGLYEVWRSRLLASVKFTPLQTVIEAASLAFQLLTTGLIPIDLQAYITEQWGPLEEVQTENLTIEAIITVLDSRLRRPAGDRALCGPRPIHPYEKA
jgi:hypothetical protein